MKFKRSQKGKNLIIVTVVITCKEGQTLELHTRIEHIEWSIRKCNETGMEQRKRRK